MSEKLGKFTRIEYKGQKGYAVSQSVKKLNKNQIAVVNKDTYRSDEPVEKLIRSMIIHKGKRVTLLGEGKDGFVKVEYMGKPYWISAKDIEW